MLKVRVTSRVRERERERENVMMYVLGVRFMNAISI